MGISLNGKDEEQASAEPGWTLFSLYHLRPGIIILLELDGEHRSRDATDGENMVHLTPGFRVLPFDEPNIQIGLRVRLPLTRDREFRVKYLISAFYLF